MNVNKDQLVAIITVLILLEAIIVLAWMDMNWNQITTLVQVMLTNMHLVLVSVQLNNDKILCTYHIILLYIISCNV